MKCKECLEIIEAFFDGELDGQTADLVSSHIAECSSCADAYQSLEAEQEFYLSRAYDVEVSPFFWANVSEKVKAEKSDSPLRAFVNLFASFRLNLSNFNAKPVTVACFLIFAISVTFVWLANNSKTPAPSADAVKAFEIPLPEVAILNTENKKPVGKNKPLTNKTSKPVKASDAIASNSRKKVENKPTTSDEIAKKAERKYLEAIAILSRDVNKRRSQLDPETVEQFMKTLAVVDRTIKSTRQAVRDNPNDSVAVQYMLSAYAQKVDVLRGLVSY